MKKPARSRRIRRWPHLSLVLLVGFAAGYAAVELHATHGAKAATALCEGQPGTHTVVAPSSVTPGQSFQLTNLTGAANTNIATVDSVTLTLAVSGASPAAVSETWNGGPVHGDYTATYDTVNLTATGGAGSSVSVSLSSIEAHIELGGVSSTITCSVANGQLTANSAGQSFNLANIAIVAPAASPGSTPAQKSTVSKTAPGASTPAASAAPSSASNPAAGSTAPGGQVNGQDLNISVQDYQARPISGARVALDSLPLVNTGDDGIASFKQVAAGNHNLSVIASGQTVTRALTLGASSVPLSVQIKLPGPRYRKYYYAAGVVGLVVLGLAIHSWRRHAAANRALRHHFPFGPGKG